MGELWVFRRPWRTWRRDRPHAPFIGLPGPVSEVVGRDRRGGLVRGVPRDLVGGADPDLAIKTPVAVASTGPLVLSGLQTIDGYALADGDRVLVKDQVDARDNGIWVASTGVWTRAVDCARGDRLGPGLIAVVRRGTVGSGTLWSLTTRPPVVLGFSSLTWRRLVLPPAALIKCLDGGGVQLTVGDWGYIEVPFDCRIVGATALADRPCSVELDIRRVSFADYPATPAHSICGPNRPLLAGGRKYRNDELAGWSTAVGAGAWIGFSITSAPAAPLRVVVSLAVVRAGTDLQR